MDAIKTARSLIAITALRKAIDGLDSPEKDSLLASVGELFPPADELANLNRFVGMFQAELQRRETGAASSEPKESARDWWNRIPTSTRVKSILAIRSRLNGSWPIMGESHLLENKPQYLWDFGQHRIKNQADIENALEYRREQDIAMTDPSPPLPLAEEEWWNGLSKVKRSEAIEALSARLRFHYLKVHEEWNVEYPDFHYLSNYQKIDVWTALSLLKKGVR